MAIIPTVIEKTPKGERAWDPYSRLLKDRTIFLDGQVNDEVASSIIAQMLFLQLENKDDDINLYIMSPGGSVTAGLAIYDTMQFITNDVSTVCLGQAASMGAFLLAAGTKGKRLALPSSRIMIHQPSGGSGGMASDIKIQCDEILYLRERLNTLFAYHTGKDLAAVHLDMERDNFMSANEAKSYGIVDDVFVPDLPGYPKELPRKK